MLNRLVPFNKNLIIPTNHEKICFIPTDYFIDKCLLPGLFIFQKNAGGIVRFC